MTSYRNLVILLLATAILCPTAGAARPSTDRSGAKIIEVLKRSRLPLAEAVGECRDLAEHYPTLGKLVAAHDKLATRERRPISPRSDSRSEEHTSEIQSTC